MNPNLLNSVRVDLVKVTQTSAGTAVTTDSVDMQGYDAVVFVGGIVTANAGNHIKVSESSDDATFNDLAGTKVTPSVNGQPVSIDIVKPKGRYVRAEFDRSGADTALETVYAIRYRGRRSPVTNLNAETHVSPAQGTA